jgi:hypothetical protein
MNFARKMKTMCTCFCNGKSLRHALAASLLAVGGTAATAYAGGETCTADLNGDGVVNGEDLAILLGQWGPCGGACCLPDNSCVANTTEDECFELGGKFQGFVSCAVANCSGELGACCLTNPFQPCINSTGELECLFKFGGVWQGDGVNCAEARCTGNGACCLTNPEQPCINSTGELECLFKFGGVWAGEGVNCAGAQCTGTGACCLSQGACLNGLGELECTFKFGGVWQGDGTLCSEGCNP